MLSEHLRAQPYAVRRYVVTEQSSSILSRFAGNFGSDFKVLMLDISAIHVRLTSCVLARDIVGCSRTDAFEWLSFHPTPTIGFGVVSFC